jgi:hypothetical protein
VTPPAQSATGGAPGDARFDHLLAELRVRLRPACRGWHDAEFETLVHNVARVKFRWLLEDDQNWQ